MVAPNAAPSIIPSLQTWEGGEGHFLPTESTRILVDDATRHVGRTLATEIESLLGLTLAVTDGEPADGDIALRVVADLAHDRGGERFHAEGYRLSATERGVAIEAPSARGVFYGTRTLLQGLLGSAEDGFPAGTTDDWPDHGVRGFMLDVARRQFSLDALRRYIVRMGWYKLNEFQIHLNDNQLRPGEDGWTSAFAAFRLQSDNPDFAGLASTDTAYTRADWDALEDLAEANAVTLVPEIDVPGHSLALIRWRPGIGMNGDDSEMLDLSKSETTAAVKEIFDEFTPWFRGPYLHYGADEYTEDEPDAYREFFNEMAAHVRSLGKQPRAWGSISQMHGSADGYDRDVVINAWNWRWYGMDAAHRDGYEFIDTDDSALYLVPYADYYQGESLRNRDLYETWVPGRNLEEQVVEPGAPLGAMFAVWNDLIERDYDEADVEAMIKDSFPVIAQKTWASRAPEFGYDAFTTLTGEVGPRL